MNCFSPRLSKAEPAFDFEDPLTAMHYVDSDMQLSDFWLCPPTADVLCNTVQPCQPADLLSLSAPNIRALQYGDWSSEETAAMSSPSLSSPTPPPHSAGPSRRVVKRSHRQIDADRRRAESEMYRQLETVTQQQRERARSEKRRISKAGRESRKLMLLRAGIERIQELEQAISEMQQRRSATDDSQHTTGAAALPFNPAVTCEPQVDNGSQYAMGSYLHSCLATMVLELRSDSIVDANDTFLRATHWSHSQLRHLDLCGPCSSHHNPIREQQLDGALRGDDEYEDEAGFVIVRRPSVQQWPSTLSQCKEMNEGRLQSFRAAWRWRWADDRCREVQIMAWVVKSERVEESNGDQWERPLVVQCSFAEYETSSCHDM